MQDFGGNIPPSLYLNLSRLWRSRSFGKEGATRRAGHQSGHLPLVDGPIELLVSRQGPVPELPLLPLVVGVVAEASREHGGCGGVAGGYIL